MVDLKLKCIYVYYILFILFIFYIYFKVSYFVYQIKFEIIEYRKRYPAAVHTEQKADYME